MNRLVGTLWFAYVAACAGCGTAVGDEPFSEALEVDEATAELRNCTTLNVVPTDTGFTDQLQCDGVLCNRQCLNSILINGERVPFQNGFVQCTTLSCEHRPSNASGPFIDLSILRPECQIQPSSRVNAGFKSRQLTQFRCETEFGGCWDSRTTDPRFPWCYEPIGKSPTCAGIEPNQRINAGTRSTTPEQCIKTLGQCWDDAIPNVNFCFRRLTN